jgi:transposase
MLSYDTRVAILTLHSKNTGIRAIARTLRVSRAAVQRVIEQGTADAPTIARTEQLSAEIDRIRELHASCQGNLVRVHEELAVAGIKIAYTTLTAFCRRHEIGTVPKQVVGSYQFFPGEEMQHDTSPHRPMIAGKPRLVQCASLVLCYSRMVFAQVYPKFNRFWCKVFLVDAIQYFEGAAGRCMLDNSSIIIAHGTGKNAVPAPEMAALGADFGFEFAAHELGDANRSARVERNFDFIESNFYVGRNFSDIVDCNRQMRAWCDKVNETYKRSLRAAPRELFAVEKPALRRLPLHTREPNEVAHRTVDALGFVTLHTNSYSAPLKLLDRPVDIIATKDRVRLFDGHRLVCEHIREEDGAGQRKILPEHKEERRQQRPLKSSPCPHEEELNTVAPEFAELTRHLKSRHPGRAVRALRRLHQLYLDYPTDQLRAAIRRALDHGLYDLGRIEAMVLSSLSGSFFRESQDLWLDESTPSDPEEDEQIQSESPNPSEQSNHAEQTATRCSFNDTTE